ncbi:MAG: hypothetical protein PHT94_00315 [Candidatus Nanoarchaeia archaeon]|nr:hypothetical protein [Candidatus Nanoarchaeia archaeon]
MSYIIINLNLKYNNLSYLEIKEYITFKLEKVRVKYNIIKINERILIIEFKNLNNKKTLKILKKINIKYLSLIFNIDILEKIIKINNNDNYNLCNSNYNNNNNNNNINNLKINHINKKESEIEKIYEKNQNDKLIKINKEYKINFFNLNKIEKNEFESIKKIIFNNLKTNKKANLRNPKIIINSYILNLDDNNNNNNNNNNFIIISKNIFSTTNINFKMNELPGFMPTVTDYKLSNALFNIADISKNSIIVDPFCGIGGFFINNPYKNKKILNELYVEVIKKLKMNLDFLKVKNYLIKNYDGLKLSNILNSKKQYLIITDIPYGKSCKLSINYLNFFENFLKDSKNYFKTMVIALPIFNDKDEIIYKEIIEKNELNIKLSHKIFVNKSLSKLIIKIKN